MKFIIRDDDVSYHFQPVQLSAWYEGIIEICPVSICIPPFIKGNFFDGIYRLDHNIKRGREVWLADESYKIGDNKELVEYLKNLIAKGKVSIGLHGIRHRNEEERSKTPMKGNYITGAEFYTDIDYTDYLHEAKEYLENLFNIKVNYFSPPQNLVSTK